MSSWPKLLHGALAFGLALVSGALLAASLPPHDHAWLAWLALALLLYASARRRPVEAAGLGMAAGMACGAAHGYLSTPFFLLALVLAGVSGAASLARRSLLGLPWVLSVGCAGVVAEWLTMLLAPLPVNLALTQYRQTALVQVAGVAGIWGVSFLLWSVGAGLAEVAITRRLPALLVPGAAVLACVVFGVVSLRRPTGPTLRAAAIQEWSGELGEVDESNRPGDRLELTREAAARGAKLVVWSETCLGSAFRCQGGRDEAREAAAEYGVHVVAGYLEPAGQKYWNCAAMVAPDGSVPGVHRKNHLFLAENQGTLAAKGTRGFDTRLGRLGMEICFDTCYTDVTRLLARDGVRLVAMPNYDPPSPRAILHYLHSASLPFRAAESGISFVRADPNGLSQIADPRGRLLAEAPVGRAAVLLADVPLGDGRGTLFSRLGDWLVWVCLAGLLILPAAWLRSLRKASQAPGAAPPS